MAAKDSYKNYGQSKSFPARLQDLVVADFKNKEEILKKRTALLKMSASGFYDKGYGRWHTLNLVGRGVGAIVPYLVEGNPRVQVETRIVNYRPWALTTQLFLNHKIEDINLANNVLIPGAINSMFGAAIARTDFYFDRLISLDNEVIKVGTPYVELIDDSNYVCDPSAKRRCDITFEGDIYQLPTEYAKDFFSGKDKGGNEIADYILPDATLRAEIDPKDISNPNFNKNLLNLREFTTFIDIYLRDENTIVTIMPKGKKAKILRERPWDGPDEGPYDYLGYRYQPLSPYPIPPAWDWHDIDETVNILVDKMRELAENQKDVVAYNGSAAEDVKNVVDAPNIGTVRVEDVDAMKTISLNGIRDSSNWDWVNFMLGQQTQQGANPDVLAGRGSNAPTLGQEQMIYSNATRIVNNYYTRYQDWMTGIIKKLAWGFWTDPTEYYPIVKDVPGIGKLPEVFSTVDRVGDFYDFAFKIVNYSTQRMSPELQYNKVIQFMNQWLLPMLPLATQQGAMLDVPTVTKILADYAGLESFNQYFRTAVPDPLEQLNFQMTPVDKMGDRGGQGNDSGGAMDFSRNGNLNQQQAREGHGMDLNQLSE